MVSTKVPSRSDRKPVRLSCFHRKLQCVCIRHDSIGGSQAVPALALMRLFADQNLVEKPTTSLVARFEASQPGPGPHARYSAVVGPES
jgi:hypothetical protein